MPNDHESYVHRIGRTGRAGKEGIAITFIGGKNELRHVKMLERKFKLVINPIDVPTAQDIQKVYLQKACDYLETLAQKNSTVAPEIEAAVRCFEPAELTNIVIATVAEKFFPATRKDDFHFANISNQSFDDGGTPAMMAYKNL